MIDVDRRGVVLVLQSLGDEDGVFGSVGCIDTIDEVAAALDHALVDQSLEGLLLAAYAEVEEELVPEA